MPTITSILEYGKIWPHITLVNTQGWQNALSELPEPYIYTSGQVYFFNPLVRGQVKFSG